VNHEDTLKMNNYTIAIARAAGAATVLALLAACGGGGGGDGGGGGGPTGQFSLGGSVSNLSASGLLLRNQAGDTLAVPAGATAFEFAARLAPGAAYAVTVATQPGTQPGQSQDCSVANATGTASANVGNVVVSCGPVGPLSFVSSDPADGATGVPRATQPRLTFSAPLQPVDGGAVMLQALGFGLPKTLRADGSALVIEPPGRLLPLTSYEIFVANSAAIAGTRGEHLPGDVSQRSFVTADNSWKPLDTVPGTEAKGNPGGTMALDARGNVFAAWSQGGAHQIARRDAALGTWDAPRATLAHGVQATSFQIATDAAGNALAVWSDYLGLARSRLMAARYSASTRQWEAPQPLSGDADENERPAIAVAPSGELAVAWRRLVLGEGHSIWMRSGTTASGAAWGAPRRVDDDADQPVRQGGVQMSAPVLGLVRAPGILRMAVAWSNVVVDGGSQLGVFVRVYGDGEPILSQPVRVSASVTPQDSAIEPQLKIDAGGHTLVAWRLVDPGPNTSPTPTTSQVLMRIHDGNAWHAVFPVSPVDVFATQPRLASGNAAEPGTGLWVSWAETAPSSRAMAARVQGTQAVTGVQVLDGALHADGAARAVHLAVDLAGNVLALWAGGDEGAPATALHAARYDARAGSWGARQDVATQQELVGVPATSLLLVNPSGDIVAWWQARQAGMNLFPLRLRRFD
jgi:hypothetical protein